MPTHSYRIARDDRVPDAAELLDGRIGPLIKQQYLPRIAKRNRIAVQGQAVFYYLFNRIPANQGRRCSCFKLETSASSDCVACFNTGVVGGYTKYGNCLVVFDVTHPDIRAVNIMPDYMARTKPTKFTLIPGATTGWVETKVKLVPNLGKVDNLSYDYEIVEGGELSFYIKAPSDSSYVTLTTKTLAQRLGGNPWLSLKVELKRVASNLTSPKFGLVYLRYQTNQQPLLKFDITPTDRQKILGEQGSYDDWQRQNFWTDATLRRVNPQDFLVSQDDDSRWVIFACKEIAPVGVPTSWDLQTRLMQYSEVQTLIPVGSGGSTT